jgi:hypothetical protein
MLNRWPKPGGDSSSPSAPQRPIELHSHITQRMLYRLRVGELRSVPLDFRQLVTVTKVLPAPSVPLPDWNRAREIAARGGDLAVDC